MAYAPYTQGMEVTIITRRTMGTNTFTHCLVTRANKTCVWTGDERWKFDGKPWGFWRNEIGHLSNYSELVPREIGLRREQDHILATEQAAYAKRYRELTNALLQHRPYCKTYREGQSTPPETLATARELLTILETGVL